VPKKRERLIDQVRRAVDASGLSRFSIYKAVGVSHVTTDRFTSGQCGLSMDSLDALVDLINLIVTAV
jgi:hypothetical protein